MSDSTPTTGTITDQIAPTLLPASLGPAVGRFEPIRPHAQGGQGEVLLARDVELGREVAFKRIQPHLADHPVVRGRFLREAEVTARLEHPGVVPVAVGSRAGADRESPTGSGRPRGDSPPECPTGRGTGPTLVEVLGDLQGELADVPAARPARVRWMTRALEPMDKVVVNTADSADANHASIWALFEIGDIDLSAGGVEMDVDDKPKAEPGRWTERAKEVYGRAHALARRAAEADLTNVEAKRDLSVSYNKLGDVSLRLAELKTAEAADNASLGVRQEFERFSGGWSGLGSGFFAEVPP